MNARPPASPHTKQVEALPIRNVKTLAKPSKWNAFQKCRLLAAFFVPDTQQPLIKAETLVCRKTSSSNFAKNLEIRQYFSSFGPIWNQVSFLTCAFPFSSVVPKKSKESMLHRYHLSGHNIVLDTCSGVIHAVDEVAYDAIALYQNHNEDEIVLPSEKISKNSGNRAARMCGRYPHTGAKRKTIHPGHI